MIIIGKNPDVPDKKLLKFNLDKQLSDEVDNILAELGLDSASLITALYKRVAAEYRIPFALALTEEEKAKHRLVMALRDIPVNKIETREDLEKWLADDE